MKAVDLTGQRFGRLMAIEVAARGKNRLWKCQCDCGGITVVASQSLRSGNTRSCGCWMRAANLQHGHAIDRRTSPTYKAWISMHWRCRNPEAKQYPAYGGRGITVCERWEKFENFLADMGEKPAGTSLDRYPNNDGNYEPSNCRWATSEEQARNRRTTRLNEYLAAQIRAQPETVSTLSIARRLGVSFNAAHCCRIGKTWKQSGAAAHES